MKTLAKSTFSKLWILTRGLQQSKIIYSRKKLVEPQKEQQSHFNFPNTIPLIPVLQQICKQTPSQL